MTEPARLPEDVKAEVEVIRSADLVIGVATTAGPGPALPVLASTIRANLDAHFASRNPVLVRVDRTPSDEPPAPVESLSDLRVVQVRPAGAPRDPDGDLEWSVAVHAVLEVGRALGAPAIVMMSAECAATPGDWLRLMAEPVLKEAYGLILPVYQRNRYDGTLTQTLVAPFVRALFGRQLWHPLAEEFACSAEAADFLLNQDFWESDLGRSGLDLLIPVAIIDQGLSVGQSVVGVRAAVPSARPAPLGRTVGRVAGALFGLAERFETTWLEGHSSDPAPIFGSVPEPLTGGAPVDPERLQTGFRQGVRDLFPVWERILAPDNLGDVLALSESGDAAFRFTDQLWARVVYDFLLAYRARVIYRSHLAQSLAPLYLGRAASLVLETRARPASAVAQATMRQGRVFEQEKPYLVDRWR